jgi:hypothetical protein
MRMKIYMPKFLGLILWVLTAGCVFNPDGDDNFKVVNPEVVIAPFQVDLNFADDTVNVFGQMVFQFTITNLDPKLQYYVIFGIDDRSFSFRQLSGSFTYDPPLITGYQTLKMQVFIRSGTGSLADRLESEFIVYEQSWVLKIDTKAPDVLNFTVIKPDKGSLKLEWPKYSRLNFKSYRINKISGFTYTSFVISDPDSSFFYDEAYVGGEASYQLLVEAKNNSASSDSFVSYSDEIPTMIKTEMGSLPSTSLKIFFSSSRYPANMDHYEVYETSDASMPGTLLFSTSNPTDTLFTMKPIFGKARYIYIATVAKRNGQYTESVVSTPKEYVYGEKINDFETILFATNKDRFYTVAYSASTLNAFTISGNEAKGTLDMPEYTLLQISPAQDKLIGLRSNKLFFWDALTLSLLDVLDLSSLLLEDQYFNGFGLTTDNRLLLSKTTDNNGNGNLVVYDLTTRIVLNEYTGFGQSRYIELSDDGNLVRSYGLYFPKIKRIENNQISLSGLTVNPDDQLFFNPENQTQAIHGSYYPLTGGSIRIWNIDTWEVIAIISTPSMRINSMDIVSGIAGGLKADEVIYQVYDYKNQKLLWEGVPYQSAQVHGDYIYSSNGARLKIRP